MKIGLVPMAAKPYHAGHDGLVRIAAAENDVVHLYVSTSDRKRPGEIPIYGADMLRVWREFLEPTLPPNVEIIYGGSPVGNIYKEIGEADQQGKLDVFSIYSDKDDIEKYTDVVLSRVAPTLFKKGRIVLRGIERSSTVNIRGEDMRSMLANRNTREFAKFLPVAVRSNAKAIMSILNPTEPSTKLSNKKSSMMEHTLRQYIAALIEIL